jgi:hypothetical protein
VHWDCPDHIPEHANPGQPIRLFGCREAQGTSAELVEVGDLSCHPIDQASVCFDTVAAASRAGKEALKKLLDELQSKHLRWRAA